MGALASEGLLTMYRSNEIVLYYKGPAGTAGKQFYLAFMNDNDLYIEGNVSITLTPATSLPATIHVESSFSNWKTDFTLNPGDVKQLSARKYEVIVLADVTYQATHGIIITSTSDIVVVAQYISTEIADISLQTCVINISAEKEISVTVNMPLMWMDVNPSNLVIPSTDQYTSNSMFVVPETPFEASTTFFVGFVSRIGIESFEAVTLDGTLLPNAGYHEIGIGVHNLTTNRDMFVYIFAVSEKKTDGSNLPAYSYAYAAGMLIQQIVQDCIPSLEIVDGVDNDCDGVIDEDPCYTTLNAM
ncbi:Hypothetical predicted protein, partial [Mytilus galloprovincialis]